MIGVFKQKNPGNLFLLFILGMLLRLPAFFGGKEPIVKELDSLLYANTIDFLNLFGAFFPGIFVFIAYLLIFLQVFLLSFFINNNRLMYKPNFLAGMAYMILTALIPEFNTLSSPLIASTIFIAVFALLFTAHNQKITRAHIFNAGLLLGIATIFFLPSLFFVIFAYAILGSLKPFKLNEWLILLLGVLTPYYFLAIGLYLTDNFSLQYFYNEMNFGIGTEKYTIWHAGALFLILMPLLVGFYYMQVLSGRMLIHVRKAWNLFAFYIVISAIVPFINIGHGLENWVLIGLPAAALHGFGYFNAEWKPYPKIAFWLSVAFIISSQIFSGLWF